MRTLIIAKAHWLIMFQLDRHFDLTKQQKHTLRPLVDDTLQWIRSEKAPELQSFFADAIQTWMQGPTEESLHALGVRYEAFRVELFEKIAPEAGHFLASLSEDQLQHLAKRLAKSNEESEELAELSPEDFVRKQRKRYIHNLDDWLDDVSDRQEELFLEAVPFDQDGYKRYVVGRRTAQANFIAFIRKNKRPEDISRNLVLWAREPNLLRNEPKNENQMKRMWFVILVAHRIATPKQRQHVANEIASFQRDMFFGERR